MQHRIPHKSEGGANIAAIAATLTRTPHIDARPVDTDLGRRIAAAQAQFRNDCLKPTWRL